MSGAVSYQAGKAAEDIVARHYYGNGFQEEQRRWRGPGGEIDLIVSQGDQTVFVEVKKSKDFEQAATRVSARQLERIQNSATGYLERKPNGQNSDSRVDVALVNEIGDVEILENVTM